MMPILSFSYEIDYKIQICCVAVGIVAESKHSKKISNFIKSSNFLESNCFVILCTAK